jgi:hypothetical protein
MVNTQVSRKTYASVGTLCCRYGYVLYCRYGYVLNCKDGYVLSAAAPQ